LLAFDSRRVLGVIIFMLLFTLSIAGCSMFRAVDKTMLLQEDFAKVYELCESFLRDSYYAQEDASKIDLSRYIVDLNLLRYARKKIEAEVRAVDIVSIEVHLMEHAHQTDRYLLTLNAKVTLDYGGSFGERTQLLVKNIDGRLVIADWYTFKGRSGFDDVFRGPQGITNPTVWEDVDKAKELLRKVGVK